MKRTNFIAVGSSLTFRQRIIFLNNVENSSEIIEQATDGDEFITLLTDHQPDLILMDIPMPQLNGIELIRQSILRVPGLKMIAATQFGDDEFIVSLIKTDAKGTHSTLEIERDIHSYLTVENYCMNNLFINIINKTSVNKLQLPNPDKRISVKARKLYSKFNQAVR